MKGQWGKEEIIISTRSEKEVNRHTGERMKGEEEKLWSFSIAIDIQL
jgi:hypothetical protein